MLVVTVAIYAGHGIKTLNHLRIINDGSGTIKKGNYTVFLDAQDGRGGAMARVEGYDRARGALPLVMEAITRIEKIQKIRG